MMDIKENMLQWFKIFLIKLLLVTKSNKGFRFLLCLIDVYSK